MVQHVWRNLDDVKSPLRRKYSNRTQVKYMCLCVCRRNHDLTPYRLLVLLPPKAAALGEPGSAPCGGHGHHHKHRLGVTEHSVVHEVALGVLDQSFQLVLPLFLSKERRGWSTLVRLL